MRRIHFIGALAVLAVAALSQVPKPSVPSVPGPFPIGPPNFCSKWDAKAYEASIYGRLDRFLPPPIDGANPPWECIGPEGGNIVGLDYDRADPRRLFVATGSGGVYRSVDSGDSWVKLLANSGENIGFAVDPTNAQKLYALGTYYMRRSLDGGASWQSFSFPSYCYANCGPVVDPTSPNTLYAAAYHYYNYPADYNYSMAVLKSTNGGQTWSCVDLNPTVNYGWCYGIGLSPVSPNTLFIGGYEYSGSYIPRLYKSTNGGANWTDVTGTINYYPYAIAFHPLDVNQVFVGTSSKVFRSLDGGGTWAASNGWVAAYELAVDSNNPSILYAGGYGASKSVDGGVNWASSGSGFAGFAQDLKLAGGSIFMPGTAGVFRSDDAALTWLARNSNLRAASIPALAVSPAQPQTIYIEFENYSLMKSLNAGGSWQTTATPDQCSLPAKLVAHPTDANHVYFLSGG